MIFENIILQNIGVDPNNITREEIESEGFRQRVAEDAKKYISSLDPKNKFFSIYKFFTVTDHMVLLKAQQYDRGFDNFFLNAKNIDKNIPRFTAYSTIDTLIEETYMQQEIYMTVLSQKAQRFQLNDESDFDKMFDLRDHDNVLKNFIFSYSDSGHSFQHHKAQDLSVKLSVFIKALDEIVPVNSIQEYTQQLFRPSL